MARDDGSSAEFRESSRAPLQAPAEVQLDAFSPPLAGQTVNISVGGLFLELNDPPPVGSLVRFKIQLGSPPTAVEGTGEVVWIRAHSQGPELPPGIGVQFRFVEEGAQRLRSEVERALVALGPEPEPAPRRPATPPPRPRPAPSAPPSPPTLGRASKRRRTGAAKTEPTEAASDDKKILGMPAEKAKVIVLLVLFAVLALVVLL